MPAHEIVPCTGSLEGDWNKNFTSHCLGQYSRAEDYDLKVRQTLGMNRALQRVGSCPC